MRLPPDHRLSPSLAFRPQAIRLSSNQVRFLAQHHAAHECESAAGIHASETAPAHGFRGQHRSKTICAGADSPDLHSLLSQPAHVERNLEFVQLMLLLADGRVDALHNGKLAKCQRQAQNLCMQRRSAALRCSFQRRYRAVDTAHNTGGIIGNAPLPVGSSVPGRQQRHWKVPRHQWHGANASTRSSCTVCSPCTDWIEAGQCRALVRASGSSSFTRSVRRRAVAEVLVKTVDAPEIGGCSWVSCLRRCSADDVPAVQGKAAVALVGEALSTLNS